MSTNIKDFIGRAGAQFAGNVKGTTHESTVSTGTAPLIVASTTLVSNLNAQYLNGLSSSSFLSNPMTTRGDIITGAASGVPQRLALGTNNYVLTSDGTDVVWTANQGTGSVVRATSPTLTTPTLGVATATSINKVTITQPATGSTITVADGKTLTASNTLTFTGTDSSSVAFGAGGTVAYTANKLNVFAATTSSELAGVISDETGSGGVLVFNSSPSITTPTIDSIVASASGATTTIHSAVTTGSITIGAGLTTGTLNLAAAGTGATTVNIGHSNADINLTGTTVDVTGTLSATSPAITTSITTGSASFDLINTTATTANIAGAATTLNIGHVASAAQTVSIGSASTGASTYNFGTGATANATTKTINLGTGGVSGSVTNINIGASAATANNSTLTVYAKTIIKGDLQVDGTTTTTNSTTVTIDDPIFTLGGDTAPGADDNKDRGIEFRWHNGSAAKVGFFGFDDSTGYFTFIPDATNSSEVFSGTQGDIQATNFRGALVGNADTATKATNLVGGNGTTLLGSLPYQSGTDTTTMLAPNTAATKKFLNQTGTGTNGAAPVWSALVDGDIPAALTGKSYNGLTLTSTTGTFTLTNGKTFAVQNSITLAGTDGTTITLPSTTGTVALNNQTMFIGTTSVAINRSSASQALTGITSIDGSAATLAMTYGAVQSKTVTVTANATPTTIDSFATATYTSAIYTLQLKQGTKVTTTNFMVNYDGTDVNVTEFGALDAAAGAANATLSASFSAGTVTVTATSSDAATTNVVIKGIVNYIVA